MIYITRRERFSSAHKLSNENWSDEKNLATFGKCSNANWHGHNYELLVTLAGEVNPETGFVVNLSDVSKILKAKVIDKIDHKNLNLDVDFLKGVMTSTENLAIAIWNEILADIERLGCKLYSIKISETENNIVEYKGE
jgi:6-pyruvoyltetrahydropterin/6-carboxytetrahydropterin synthase